MVNHTRHLQWWAEARRHPENGGIHNDVLPTEPPPDLVVRKRRDTGAEGAVFLTNFPQDVDLGEGGYTGVH